MNVKTPINRRFIQWFALIVLATLAFFIVLPFLAPFAWAGIIAYVSWPVAIRIRRWCKGRNTLAASLTTLLAAVTILLPFIMLIWLAESEAAKIYIALQEFLTDPPLVPEILRDLPWLGDWLVQMQSKLITDPKGASSAIKELLSANLKELAALVGGVGKNLAKLIFVVMILFFFYRDGTRIIRELRHVLAQLIGPQINDYLQATGNTIRAVVYGVFLTALVQGLLAGSGYWVAGMSSPIILGLITAMVALIPFCTPIAWGLAGLWLLTQGHTAEAIGIWVWGALVVSQLDNVLRPFFISSVSPVPFLLILVGVLGGLLTFGLVGLFIGPITLAVTWAVWCEWTIHLNKKDSKSV